MDITVLEEIVTEKGCHVTFRLQFDNRGFTPSGGKDDTGIYLSSYPEIKSSTFFKVYIYLMLLTNS